MMHHELSFFQMLHECSWCVVATHDASWGNMMHNDSWGLVMTHYDSWRSMTIQDDPRWFMMTQYDPRWFMMDHSDSSRRRNNNEVIRLTRNKCPPALQWDIYDCSTRTHCVVSTNLHTSNIEQDRQTPNTNVIAIGGATVVSLVVDGSGPDVEVIRVVGVRRLRVPTLTRPPRFFNTHRTSVVLSGHTDYKYK